ncbi:Ead domain protein [Klebsiella quasipneumoniae]|uniref:hypothetical protein n=1 Tax=Klebsiella pneumoniae complex TaxID=3390273 RepID=UPI0010824757|nr:MULTISPECIES: hypothetical protein [Klebsiella]GKM82407.1 hypothetical protein NUKP68_39030 [Klebsiella variicola]VAS23660.1 Ead domain protein [Klebsiella variicola]VGH32176.1 Ead domain protein [Klebsiella quasipneumoniae]VGH39409.1 Ead domain protein [Klebsiella quasipneumoniae]
MTNITELALLVSKAKASVFTLEYISQFEPADIDSDDVDLRFEVDGRDTGTYVSIVDECGQAAKVIGTLVEALEAKDADAEWMRKRIAELAKARELKEIQRANWFQMAQKLGEDLDAAEKRIAELESRAVTVKPMRPGHITVGGEKIGIYMRDEVDEFIATLTAQGIKWEAE